MGVIHVLEKNEGPLLIRWKIYLLPLNQARYLCYSELFLSLLIFRRLNPTLIGKEWLKISQNEDRFVNSSISNKVYIKYIEVALLNEWTFKTILSSWGNEPVLIRLWPILPWKCLESVESEIDVTACLWLPDICFHSFPFNLFLPLHS